jgi:hypothetical protein
MKRKVKTRFIGIPGARAEYRITADGMQQRQKYLDRKIWDRKMKAREMGKNMFGKKMEAKR